MSCYFNIETMLSIMAARSVLSTVLKIDQVTKVQSIQTFACCIRGFLFKRFCLVLHNPVSTKINKYNNNSTVPDALSIVESTLYESH
jgi:hypothetical protein